MRNTYAILLAVTLVLSLQDCTNPVLVGEDMLDSEVSLRSDCYMLTSDYLSDVRLLFATELGLAPTALKIGAVVRQGSNGAKWVKENELIGMSIANPANILIVGFEIDPLNDDNIAGDYNGDGYCEGPSVGNMLLGEFEIILGVTLEIIGEDIGNM